MKLKLNLIKNLVLEFVLWFFFLSGIVNVGKMIVSYIQHEFTGELLIHLMTQIRMEILTMVVAAGFLLLYVQGRKWD